jgi:hypothetical protein
MRTSNILATVAVAASLLSVGAPASAQVTVGSPPAPPATRRVQGVPAPDVRIVTRQRIDTVVAEELHKAMQDLEVHVDAATRGAAAHAAAAGAQAAVAGAHAAAIAERIETREKYASLTGSRRTRLLKRISVDPEGVRLPPADSIGMDDIVIAVGATSGRIATMGRIDVHGTVRGNVVAIGEDVIVHRGGRITGDAVSVGGTVVLDGGTVEGEMRSISEVVAPIAAPVQRAGFLDVLGDMQDVMGALVIMVLLGFATLVFAEDRLRVVTETIEQRFSRSMMFGLVAEVSFIPTMIIVPLLLVITIVGIVLAPFAVVAIGLLGAALALLGFLAMSRVAGQALTRSAAPASPRGVELRSMLAGLFFFFGLWLLAAMLGWVPILGSVLRALAVVLTWAAVTVGLGAAVISRGGSRRRTVPATPAPDSLPDIAWQTPTPISGIAAARRPVTPSSES